MQSPEEFNAEINVNVKGSIDQLKMLEKQAKFTEIELLKLSKTDISSGTNKLIQETTRELNSILSTIKALKGEARGIFDDSDLQGYNIEIGKLATNLLTVDTKTKAVTNTYKKFTTAQLELKTSMIERSRAERAAVAIDKAAEATLRKLQSTTQKYAGYLSTAMANSLKEHTTKIQEVVNSISTLSTEQLHTVTGMEKYKEKLEALNLVYKKTSLEADKLVNSFGKINKVDSTSGLKAATTTYNKAQVALINYKDNVENLHKIINNRSSYAPSETIKEARKAYERLSKYAEASKSQIERLTTAQQKAMRDLEKANAKGRVSVNALEKKQEALRLATEKLNKALNTQRHTMLKGKKEVDKYATSLAKVSTAKWAVNIAKRAVAYYGLYRAITLVTSGIRDSIAYYVEFDKSARTLAAVTDGHKNFNEALRTGIALEEKIVKLTQDYGGTLEDVNKVALELARAGVPTDALIKSTEVVAKLARLTGDTIAKSSSVMVTYLQVFGKGADAAGEFGLSVEELGGKLAFMANRSKLSTEDIGTFSNYALATANAMGVTIDTIDALGAAFTNAGNTASTAGTSVRQLFLGMASNSPKIASFYRQIGISQKQLVHDLAQGGEASDKAFKNFLKHISAFEKADFNKMLSSLGKRDAKTLQMLYKTSSATIKLIDESAKAGTKELQKAMLVVDSIGVTWQKAGNIISGVSKEVVGGALEPLTTSLREMVKPVSDFVESSEFKDNIRGIISMVGSALKNIAEYGALIGGVFVVTKFVTVTSTLAKMITLTKTLTGVQLLYNKAVSANPYVIAATTLFAGFKLIEKNMEDATKRQHKDIYGISSLSEVNTKLKDINTEITELKDKKKNGVSLFDSLFGQDTTKAQIDERLKFLEQKKRRLLKFSTLSGDDIRKAAKVANIPLKELVSSAHSNDPLPTTPTETTTQTSPISGALDSHATTQLFNTLHQVSSVVTTLHAQSTEMFKGVLADVDTTFRQSLVAAKEYVNEVSKVDTTKQDSGLFKAYQDILGKATTAKSIQDVAKLKAEFLLLGKAETEAGKQARDLVDEKLSAELKYFDLRKQIVNITNQNKEKGVLDNIKAQLTHAKATKSTHEQDLKFLEERLKTAKSEKVIAFLNSQIATVNKKLERDITREKQEQLRLTKEGYDLAYKYSKGLVQQTKSKFSIANNNLESDKISAERRSILSDRYSSPTAVAYKNATNNYNFTARALGIDEAHLKQLISDGQELKTIMDALSSQGADISKQKALVQGNESAIARTKKEIEQGKTAVLKAKEELRIANIWDNSSFIDGWAEANKKYLSVWKTTAEEAAAIHKTLTDSMTRGFESFFDASSKDFMDFGSLAKGIVKSILQELIHMMAVKASVGVLGGIDKLLGLASGGSVPTTDTLGNIIQRAQGGHLPVNNYASGGKLTGGSGIRDDLYLGSASGSHVFAMGGEYILNKNATNSLGVSTLDYMNKTGNLVASSVGGSTNKTIINIKNESGTPIDLKELSRSQNDKGEETINYVMVALERNPDFRAAIRSAV